MLNLLGHRTNTQPNTRFLLARFRIHMKSAERKPVCSDISWVAASVRGVTYVSKDCSKRSEVVLLRSVSGRVCRNAARTSNSIITHWHHASESEVSASFTMSTLNGATCRIRPVGSHSSPHRLGLRVYTLALDHRFIACQHRCRFDMRTLTYNKSQPLTPTPIPIPGCPGIMHNVLMSSYCCQTLKQKHIFGAILSRC